MSKKRSYALGSKWRLGKLDADYKEHKKNKKALGYLTEPTMRSRKKTKCEHSFVFKEIKKYAFLKDSEFEIHACEKCHKIKWLTKKQTASQKEAKNLMKT